MTKDEAKVKLLERVVYDETSSTFLRTTEGKEIGYLNTNGYARVTQDKFHFSIHAIVWEIHNGPIPIGFEVDHKDTVQANNLISNLRLATKGQNEANKGIAKHNKSGVKGLSYDNYNSRWRGQVWLDKKLHKTVSKSREEVEAWLITKRPELHGQFARSN